MMVTSICLWKCTDLLIVQPNVITILKYHNEILEPTTIPSVAVTGDRFLLMPDNTRPHYVRFFMKSLAEEKGIEWPTGSPDLKPIEYC